MKTLHNEKESLAQTGKENRQTRYELQTVLFVNVSIVNVSKRNLHLSLDHSFAGNFGSCHEENAKTTKNASLTLS